MHSLLDIQKRLLPDILPIMQKRYQILHYIGMMEPVGRRSLSVSLGITERVLRAEVEFLKGQNLIVTATSGMSLTADGKELLEGLSGMMREISGVDEMEKSLKRRLGIHKVIVVSGDSEESPWVKSELGRAAAVCMKSNLKGENIIAVTGGSTIAAIAEVLTPELISGDVLFVPARGGIGEDVKNQANTICSKMAEQTSSRHRVLYVPDQVSREMYKSIINMPEINEVLNLIKSATMVIHGIGDAIKMAKRRNSSDQDIATLQNGNAIGEAFGYYFNEAGEVVHKVQTIGLQLEDLANASSVIAVAGGASKAKAIAAYMNRAPSSTILVTDEGAAKQLLQS